MLELRTVGRRRRGVALDDISLEAPAGTTTVLAGLEPDGRAALRRLLAGADPPDAGSLRLDGRPLAQSRRRIVVVGPGGLKPDGTLLAKALKGARGEAERAGLSKRLDMRLKALSPEERVRAAIAAARAGRPQLVVLDAPLDGLADAARGRLIEALPGLLADLPAPVVYLASGGDEAPTGDRLAVFDGGRLVQAGPTQAVMAEPATLAAAAATSHPQLNRLACRRDDSRADGLRLKDGASFQPPAGVAPPEGAAVTFAFRPEDAAFTRTGPHAVRFPALSLGASVLRGRGYLRLSFAQEEWLAAAPPDPPGAGIVCNVFVEAERLLAFDADGRASRSALAPAANAPVSTM
jgi:ABC-type sugar transport system ATPase subunit